MERTLLGAPTTENWPECDQQEELANIIQETEITEDDVNKT